MATLDVNPEHYQAQLADKIARLKAMFVDYSMPELEVFESPVANYRMRAEFRIWHEGDDMYSIMINQETRERYHVDKYQADSSVL
ncbi:tRNA (uridine(54)-C5)-methyltransferase TrmA, partial [Vibrio cholerae]